MAKNKTAETTIDPVDYILANTADQKQEDSLLLLKKMEEWTGFSAKMWGPSIIGFGTYHYKYASGHEGDAPVVGFSPRKDAFSLYVIDESEKRDELLQNFGKYKMGKACIYVKKLADIDMDILEQMVKHSADFIKKKYPG